MICKLSGKPPVHCVPSRAMYERGCRCEAAVRANRDYQRALHGITVCPMCLRATSRDSGFCAKCERELGVGDGD